MLQEQATASAPLLQHSMGDCKERPSWLNTFCIFVIVVTLIGGCVLLLSWAELNVGKLTAWFTLLRHIITVWKQQPQVLPCMSTVTATVP
jgi:hypothetical protein